MANAEIHALFSGGELYNEADAKRQLLSQELRALDRDCILRVEIEEYCRFARQKYGFEVPVLGTPELLPPEPATVPRPEHWGGGRYEMTHVSGMKWEMVVPFEGDPDLFKFYPNGTLGRIPPYARVISSELHIAYLFSNDRPNQQGQLKEEFERDLKNINYYLEGLRAEAESWHRDLEPMTRAILRQKKDEIARADEAAARLGFAIRRRSNAPDTYKPPVTRRQLPIHKPPAQPTDAGVPALDMEEYEHILDVMSNMVSVMERSPGAFREIKEEDLRVHFLVQLNGHYDGQATGETFNLGGKTDILISVGGRHIFIAECKYWKGEAEFRAAIDQLLSYLTWRDTKAAIVLFNRNKNLTSVLRQIPKILESHPGFVRHLPYKSETGFRCILRNTTDPDRDVLVTVLIFDVPESI